MIKNFDVIIRNLIEDEKVSHFRSSIIEELSSRLISEREFALIEHDQFDEEKTRGHKKIVSHHLLNKDIIDLTDEYKTKEDKAKEKKEDEEDDLDIELTKDEEDDLEEAMNFDGSEYEGSSIRKAGRTYHKRSARTKNEKDEAISEEFDQLDEISKAMAGRYINKAADSGNRHSITHTKNQADYDDTMKNINTAASKLASVDRIDLIKRSGKIKDWHDKKQAGESRKIYNRGRGIYRAAKKLTREEFDQLDEISNKLKARYVGKSIVNSKKDNRRK